MFYLNCGIDDVTYCGTSKNKVIKYARESARNNYKHYLEACKENGDKPELKLNDWLCALTAEYIETDERFTTDNYIDVR